MARPSDASMALLPRVVAVGVANGFLTEVARPDRAVRARVALPAALGAVPASAKAAYGVITAPLVLSEMAAADRRVATGPALATPADPHLMAGLLPVIAVAATVLAPRAGRTPRERPDG